MAKKPIYNLTRTFTSYENSDFPSWQVITEDQMGEAVTRLRDVVPPTGTTMTEERYNVHNCLIIQKDINGPSYEHFGLQIHAKSREGLNAALEMMALKEPSKKDPKKRK